MLDIETLKGWVPVDAVVSNGRPGFLWMDARGEKFVEPFFQQTVERLRNQEPPPEELFSEFDAVIQLEKIVAGLKPDGFIFHSSRCGSTLIANALKCIRDALVVSEASAIDKLIARFITDASNDYGKQVLYSVILRGVINALGQPHCGHERRFFIKFSCCSTAQLRHIQRIWPEVPRVFLYRDPVETIVSNLKKKPEWLVDQDRRILAAITGASLESINVMSDEELCARSIGSFYLSAQELANEKCLLLNYNQFSTEIFGQVLQFFGVAPSTAELEAIGKVSQLYSKDIGAAEGFRSDVAEKQRLASKQVQELAETWALEGYRMLEQQRQRTAGP